MIVLFSTQIPVHVTVINPDTRSHRQSIFSGRLSWLQNVVLDTDFRERDTHELRYTDSL